MPKIVPNHHVLSKSFSFATKLQAKRRTIATLDEIRVYATFPTSVFYESGTALIPSCSHILRMDNCHFPAIAQGAPHVQLRHRLQLLLYEVQLSTIFAFLPTLLSFQLILQPRPKLEKRSETLVYTINHRNVAISVKRVKRSTVLRPLRMNFFHKLLVDT